MGQPRPSQGSGTQSLKSIVTSADARSVCGSQPACYLSKVDSSYVFTLSVCLSVGLSVCWQNISKHMWTNFDELFGGCMTISRFRSRSRSCGEQLSRKFFKSVLHPTSCLHSLLPPPRDPDLFARLRAQSKFPRTATRT